jgi:hypothetical protein
MPRPRLRGAHRKGPAQHPARALHVARSHHARIAELETSSPHPHRSDARARQSQTPRQIRFKFGHARLGAMPKAEVAALMHAANAQSSTRMPRTNSRAGSDWPAPHRRAAPPPRRCRSKPAAAAARLIGVSSRGASAGRRNCSGCGSKVMAEPARPRCPRLGRPLRKESPVAQVHAVEVADGGHAGAKAGRNLRERAKDGNRASGPSIRCHRLTGRLRPS